jgi:abortive infection bacteriophage resistance protein
MRYQKPALTFDKQIELLESRGLIVPDRDRAANYLSNINYYRLSAYMLPLKVSDADVFIEGTTFDDVLRLYLFDREFRLMIFDVIERLEIAFRTQISYQVGHDGGAFWFEDRRQFRDADRWREHLENLDVEVNRAREVFKDHFFSKYDENERMPIWMTSEVLSLGLLSKIYRNLRMSDGKKRIAEHFGIGRPQVLESWMQSITYVRNICAHHSRLWNRILTNRPSYLERPIGLWVTGDPDNRKIYYFTCCILYMLRSINPQTRFVKHLNNLLARHPGINLSAMGFTDRWRDDPFWQHDPRINWKRVRSAILRFSDRVPHEHLVRTAISTIELTIEAGKVKSAR